MNITTIFFPPSSITLFGANSQQCRPSKLLRSVILACGLMMISLITYGQTNSVPTGKNATIKIEVITIAGSVDEDGFGQGDPDLRLFPSAEIGATTVSGACDASLSEDTPYNAFPAILVGSRCFHSGEALPDSITLSFDAHEDESFTSNCIEDAADDDICNDISLSTEITTITNTGNSGLKDVTVVGCAGEWIITFRITILYQTAGLVSTTADDGIGSLRQVISCAQAGDTIRFSPSINGDSIQLTSGEILIDKDLVIIGNGPDSTIIDGSMDDNRRLFRLNNTAQVKMSHLTIQNGGGPLAPLLGGAILIESDADLTLFDCLLQHNRSNNTDSGGAIAVLNGSCTSINCIFDGNQSMNNSTFSRGGAVLVAGSGEYDAVNCLFVNNSSNNRGAVLTNNSGIVTLTNCTLTDNTSTSNSVLYHQTGATTTLKNNIMHSNNGSVPIVGTSTLDAKHNLIDMDGQVPNEMDGMDGNFIGDPVFVNASMGDYRLQPTSLAINKGDDSLVPIDACDIDEDGNITEQIDIDLDGNPRIRYGTVDIGAYEGVACIPSNTLYVDVNNTNPSTPADGSSWAAALTDLQEAINISNACGGGKQIWVAEGTYRPTQAFDLDGQNGVEEREKTFYITHPVQIYGGFTAGDTGLSQRDTINRNTILTADLGNSQDTAYHVMFITAASITSDWVIDGLKIQDGRAEGSYSNNRGGGIYAFANSRDDNVSTSPTLTNCIFSNNSADDNGGGIYAYASTIGARASTSPTLTNCIFSNNSAYDDGGGIYAYANSSDDRTSTSPTLTNCTFYNNSAYINGGGIYAFANSSNFTASTSPTLTNCTFYNNSADISGGGIYAFANSGDADFTASISPTLTNCILWGNTASNVGPEIWMNQSDNAKISHSVVTAGGIHIDNGIQIDTTTQYLHVDPMLVDAANGDLRLQDASPAINKGNNIAASSITMDLDGNPRIALGIVDMGAYEFGGCPDVLLSFSSPDDFGMYENKYINTNQTINADNKISGQANINYDAKEGVCLDKNFEVGLGATFVAKTDGCMNSQN